MIDYKELLCGHLKEMYGNADVLQTRRVASRIQTRYRPSGSDVLDYTPFEEIRDQDYDAVRSRNSSSTQTGDTR
jgi:hypothetical protein